MTGLLECDKVSPITHQVWHPLHKYFLQPFPPPDGGDKSNRFSTRHNWRARLNSLSFGPRTSIKFTGRANSPFSPTWGETEMLYCLLTGRLFQVFPCAIQPIIYLRAGGRPRRRRICGCHGQIEPVRDCSLE